MNREEVLRESQRWLDIISSTQLSDAEKQRIITETAENFNSYYNRGYLEYRKSMVEMREEPALEWEGQGSLLYDLTGRRFIDCLGGYGIYSAGIRHPKIIAAVRDQLERMPLSSQELLDPLRGALAELVGEIARRNELTLDPKRLNETLRLIASTYEEPQQVIDLYRNDRQLMAGLQNRVMEEQVIDWIAERAVHTDKPLSFQEAIAPQQ